MTQRNAQTIAYPAESMMQAEAPGYRPGLTGQEWGDSLLAGFGLGLATYCVPLLASAAAQIATGGGLLFIHPAIPLAVAGVCSGWLLFKRHSNDYFYVEWKLRAEVEEITGDLAEVVAECHQWQQAHANEQNRAQHAEAQLEIARKQPQEQQSRPKFTPYDGPPISEMPDNYAPYDAPLPHEVELRSGVDVEPEEEDIDLWAAAILRNHEDHGHIARERADGTGVIKAQNITQSQYIKARDLLVGLGVVGGNQHAGYSVLDVDYDAIMDAYLASKY